MRVYLDYNATCPIRPGVKTSVSKALECLGNPSSIHRFGADARALLDQARKQVADALGVSMGRVIFTSGGTEASNLALFQAAGRPILTSKLEHASVLAAASENTIGENAILIPNDENGLISPESLDELLAAQSQPVMVSVMMVNNETGLIQPIDQLAEVTHRHDGLFHTDAVQAFGRIDYDFAKLDADFFSLSAHKIGGPMGCGALIVKEGVGIKPLLCGGGHEGKRRSGTEPLPAIAGFGAAAAAFDKSELAKIQSLRDCLETELTRISNDIHIFAKDAPRAGHVSCFAKPGLKAQTVLMQLDLAGIAVSSGSACSSGKVGISHVMQAMNVPEDLAKGMLRVSFGFASNKNELDYFLEHWKKICN